MARQKLVQQQEATVAVPLYLAPLLTPYRKLGRLSLRMERMPQQARLSRGTRTNDGNWSLASDELDDLSFIVPESLRKVHKLGVRVVSLVNGDTVATLEVTADPDNAVAPPTAAATGAASAEELAELDALRRALAAAKDALAARDAELAERLSSAAGAASAQFQETLAKAESAWTESEAARLAAVQEQWQERFAEAIVDVEEEQARRYAGQIEELQHKLDELQGTLAEREAALVQAEAARERVNAHRDDAAGAAQAKLASLEAALAAREAALAAASAEQENLKREAETKLAAAERAWKDGEAERLAVAEAQLRATSAQSLAEAKADAEALHAQGASNDADMLEHLTQAQAAVAERDAALARAQSSAEAARQEAEERLSKAEAAWKAAEAARSATAEAAWQAKLTEALAAARAETSAQPAVQSAAAASDDGAELEALRAKLSTLQAKLDLREAAVARAAKLANEERLQWQKDAQDAIRKAARERKGDEGARLAQAQVEWRRQSARELALATARAEAAEAALAQVRVTTKDDTRLHMEIQALRSALEVRDAELDDLRARLGVEVEGAEAAEPDAVEAPAKAKRANTMFRDVLIAGCIGVAGVVLWPQISNRGASAPAVAPEAVVHVAPEAVAQALPRATVVKDAKLRATPSSAAAVSGKLPREAHVEVVERKDDWAHVRTGGPNGQPVEGWVKASALLPEPPVKLRTN